MGKFSTPYFTSTNKKMRLINIVYQGDRENNQLLRHETSSNTRLINNNKNLRKSKVLSSSCGSNNYFPIYSGSEPSHMGLQTTSNSLHFKDTNIYDIRTLIFCSNIYHVYPCVK